MKIPRLKLNLYRVRDASGYRFTTATSASLASLLLDGEASVANEEEVRIFWEQEKLSLMPLSEICKKYNVRRNTVGLWRARAGVRTSRDNLRERVIAALTGEKSVTQVCREANASYFVVVRIASERGYKFREPHGVKRPSDAEIIRLAEGRNWGELAAACGVTEGSLKNYIYGEASKEVREKVKKSLTKRALGMKAHGKIHIETLLDMHKSGLGLTEIARRFEVNPAAVRYWLQKNGLWP